jgi:adenylate cyclase class IV
MSQEVIREIVGEVVEKVVDSEEKTPESREYEYRFRNYDPVKVRSKIKSIGGIMIHSFQLYKSTVYNHPYNGRNKDTHIRIRDEAGKLKLTVKEETRLKFPIEYEIDLENDKNVEEILLVLGCSKKHYVEKMREKWLLPYETEIVFDMYPGCPEYMEVESVSETKLEEVVNKLGIRKHKGNFGVKDLWRQHFGINNIKKSKNGLTFENSKDLLKLVKKNRLVFSKLIEKQNQLLMVKKY